MCLHGEARLEDVLHDPQAFLRLDADDLELVAAADLDERQIVRSEMDRQLGAFGGGGHAGAS
ncbi:hypothetical protein ACU686_30200 [Yinghuangia aomiensis]